jgi:hypothetical protein
VGAVEEEAGGVEEQATGGGQVEADGEVRESIGTAAEVEVMVVVV